MTIQTPFEVWMMLLGGSLTIGLVGLTVGIIHERHERRRSR